MDRRTTAGTFFSVVLAGGMAAWVAAAELSLGPSNLNRLGTAATIAVIVGFVGLLGLFVFQPRRGGGMGDKNGDDKPPQGPKASTGIYLGAGAKRARLIGNRIKGFDTGVHDEAGDTHYHGNEIEGRPENGRRNQPARGRKFFGGFSFSKGDHRKE